MVLLVFLGLVPLFAGSIDGIIAGITTSIDGIITRDSIQWEVGPSLQDYLYYDY